MSAQEFEEWKVFYSREQLHPAAARVRQAQLLAAIFQGASSRKGGKPWAAADFLPSDPWVAVPAPAGPRMSAARRIKAMAARRRGS